MVEQVIFYVFAAVVLCSALMVVSAKNPVKATLALVLAFVGSAGLWLLLDAEFLALILVLVYVGAVMTLFLFVIMMLNLDRMQLKRSLVAHWPIVLVIVAAIIAMLVMIVGPTYFGLDFSSPTHHGSHYSDITALGDVLYTEYVFAFEVAGAILLVAIIAAIGLSFRGIKRSRSQRPQDQIRVKAEDRLRIVKMDPEK